MVTEKQPTAAEHQSKKLGVGIAIAAIVIVGLWLVFNGISMPSPIPDANPGPAAPPTADRANAENPAPQPRMRSGTASENHAPVVQELDTIQLPVGIPFAWELQAWDEDGDPLTFALFPTDAPVTLDAAGHLAFTAKQAGTYTIRVAASDGMEQTVSVIRFIVN